MFLLAVIDGLVALCGATLLIIGVVRRGRTGATRVSAVIEATSTAAPAGWYPDPAMATDRTMQITHYRWIAAPKCAIHAERQRQSFTRMATHAKATATGTPKLVIRPNTLAKREP